MRKTRGPAPTEPVSALSAENVVDDTLRDEAMKVLRALAEGARIEGRRLFPHPHHFLLQQSMGQGEWGIGTPVSMTTIDTLVTCGLVTVRRAGPTGYDRLYYHLSERGYAVAMALPKRRDR